MLVLNIKSRPVTRNVKLRRNVTFFMTLRSFHQFRCEYPNKINVLTTFPTSQSQIIVTNRLCNGYSFRINDKQKIDKNYVKPPFCVTALICFKFYNRVSSVHLYTLTLSTFRYSHHIRMVYEVHIVQHILGGCMIKCCN